MLAVPSRHDVCFASFGRSDWADFNEAFVSVSPVTSPPTKRKKRRREKHWQPKPCEQTDLFEHKVRKEIAEAALSGSARGVQKLSAKATVFVPKTRRDNSPLVAYDSISATPASATSESVSVAAAAASAVAPAAATTAAPAQAEELRIQVEIPGPAFVGEFALPDGAEGMQLIVRLSFSMTQLVKQSLGIKRGTVFHSVYLPRVTILSYMSRLHCFFKCSDSCFISALVYIERLYKRHHDIVVNEYSFHRLMLTALVVASKFYDDLHYTNTYYAKVGGITMKELNVLEQTLLDLLDWDVHIPPEEYEQYCALLNGIPGGMAATSAVARLFDSFEHQR
eukprot:TRINITY_DN11043_c0_g1_i1.p1 TRINITY_DN11043_c0_g1~~TRINITY_DN11043_c0_g1_i1.p1  ORF type:complete len:337 (+),score=55.03 TRINITY_DN11043_c0_g1_i1:57-1067(+)